jgi:hypothetical protein
MAAGRLDSFGQFPYPMGERDKKRTGKPACTDMGEGEK